MSGPAPLKGARVPWWDALPEDFYRQSNDAEIGTAPSQSVRAAAAVDRVARSVLSAALLPAIYTRRGIEQQLRALEHHKALAARGDGDATFARPIGQTLVQEMRPGKLGGSKETFLTASSASTVFFGPQIQRWLRATSGCAETRSPMHSAGITRREPGRH